MSSIQLRERGRRDNEPRESPPRTHTIRALFPAWVRVIARVVAALAMAAGLFS
ncbi:MAG: hypothetical protein L0H93_10390 [Nocardioides sp.]|nr:hypothetical protein [Nocardioides sp.]